MPPSASAPGDRRPSADRDTHVAAVRHSAAPPLGLCVPVTFQVTSAGLPDPPQLCPRGGSHHSAFSPTSWPLPQVSACHVLVGLTLLCVAGDAVSVKPVPSILCGNRLRPSPGWRPFRLLCGHRSAASLPGAHRNLQTMWQCVSRGSSPHVTQKCPASPLWAWCPLTWCRGAAAQPQGWVGPVPTAATQPAQRACVSTLAWASASRLAVGVQAAHQQSLLLPATSAPTAHVPVPEPPRGHLCPRASWHSGHCGGTCPPAVCCRRQCKSQGHGAPSKTSVTLRWTQQPQLHQVGARKHCFGVTSGV